MDRRGPRCHVEQAPNLPDGVVDKGTEFWFGLAGASGPIGGQADNIAYYIDRFKGTIVDVTVTI